MGNLNKHEKRNNRLPDGTKIRTSSDRHKKPTQLEKDRQASRDNRSKIRVQILPQYEIHNEANNIHILFIEDETPDNEKVLLETTQLDNGMYCANLPVIHRSVNKFYDTGIRMILREMYGITTGDIDLIWHTYEVEGTDEIERWSEGPIIVKGMSKEDIATLKSKAGLKSFVIRSYNPATWFRGPRFTQVSNCFYYNKGLTDTYLASTEDLGNIVISTDLLHDVLEYRVYSKKIDGYDSSYILYGSKAQSGIGLNFMDAFDDPEVISRLEREREELEYLLYGSSKGPIVQDINKFLYLRTQIEKLREKMGDKIDSRGVQRILSTYYNHKKSN